MYALGAPGTAWPPLTDPQSSSGCFGGIRMWTKKGWEADLATTCTGVLGFRHPKVEGVQGNMGGGTESWGCDNEIPNRPRGLPGASHDLGVYVDFSEDFDEFAGEAARVGAVGSYIKSEEEAAAFAQSEGWNLIGHVFNEGNSVFGGPQPSLLMQKPDTLECIITFQGSSSTQDWLSNLLVSKVDFCGLSSGSKVHKGFRDHLSRLVKSDDFQTKIQSKLGGCSKVHTVGHSLGGAMAELYGACANDHKSPGDKGYNDYAYFGWTQGTPRNMAA